MSVILAVKRSYRYFLPSSLFDLKRLVRRLFVPAAFYLLGWRSAAYSFAGVGNGEEITKTVIFFVAALIALKWWAGKFQAGDWFYQIADGSFRECHE
jgi:hypothetical protein